MEPSASPPTPVRSAAPERRALAALLAAVTLTATGPLLVRWSALPPTATAFHRFALALPMIWLWAALVSGDAPPGSRLTMRQRAWIAVAGLCLGADLAVWHRSILLTSIANATLLGHFAVVFVTVAGWLFLGERPSRGFLGGLATMLAGAAVLVGASAGLSARHALGDALGLLASVCFAGYVLVVKRLRSELPTTTIMAGSGLAAALALLPVAIASGDALVPRDLSGWTVLLALAALSQAAGQSLFGYALAHLPAGLASAGGLLQPGAAALLAWLLLGESLGMRHAVGGGAVLLGMLLAQRGAR